MPEAFKRGGEGLVEEFLRGDPAAVQVVDRWIETVLNGGFQSLRDDWDDLRQETKLRLYNNLRNGRFDGRASLRTYVHRIAKNVCIDSSRLAYRRREERVGFDGDPASASTAEEGIAGWVLRDLQAKLLDALPEGDRLLLSLVLEEHCSYAEVSVRLGVSEAAVKLRMHRCKDRMVSRYAQLERGGQGGS